MGPCDAQSNGAYKISYQQLPQAADGQRQQMVRRLAAHDTTIDILGLTRNAKHLPEEQFAAH